MGTVPSSVRMWCCFLLLCLTARPVVSLGHSCGSSGVLLNDNFDNSTTIDSTLWSKSSGVTVQKACTTSTTSALLSGNVAVFGETGTSRYITSKALSLQQARVIQFDAAACPWLGTTSTITADLQYSTDSGSTYYTLESFRMNKGDAGVHVIAAVTDRMRASVTPVQLRVKQSSPFNGRGSQVWVLDNVAVLGPSPEYIDEDFDSVTSCSFLAHTGTVKPFQSTGNALTFSGNLTSSVGHFATTIPVRIPHVSTARVTRHSRFLLEEDFEPVPLIPNIYWASIQGGKIALPDCGSIDSFGIGLAAFFTLAGNRSIETQPLDLTEADTLSFKIKIGGGGGCEAADTGEDVVVEYQSNGSSFIEMKRMAYNAYTSSTNVNISLPAAVKTASTALRWRQLSNSGDQYDEWVIDNIRVTRVVHVVVVVGTIFSEHFDTPPTTPSVKWLSIRGGSFVTPDCGSIAAHTSFSSRAAFFSALGTRSITTQPLDLSGALNMTFQVRLGGTSSSTCETVDRGEDVVVEYKLTGSNYMELKKLTYDGYTTATEVGVTFPPAAMFSSVTLRWRQLGHSGATFDEWAIDDISITGTVTKAAVTAGTTAATTFIFSEDFSPVPSIPGSSWASISGGSIRVPDCGGIGLPGFSSEAAFFSLAGSRYITTVGLDLTTSGTLSFRIRIGGGSGCEDADGGDDVVLEYKTNTSPSYALLKFLTYNGFTTAQTVSVGVPTNAKTSNTVLRWRQLSHFGRSFDEWAIDQIRITAIPSLFAEDFFPIPTFPDSKWLSLTGGSVGIPDCEPGGIDLAGYSLQAAFFDKTGTRSIQTQDLDLRTAQTLSFIVQVGSTTSICNNAESGEDVVVEYKAEGSTSFQTILILPHDAYKTATAVTVTLPFPSRTRASSLRWRQLYHSGPGFDEWAIDHIRIMGPAFDRYHVINFELNLGSSSTQQSSSYDVRLEHSIDFGKTWALAQTDCLPYTSECTQSLLNSQYPSVLFTNWRRVTVLLASSAISNNTQVRWRQPTTNSTNTWAIDSVYFGVQCPGFCSGHGRCSNATGQYEGLVCGGNSDGQPCAASFIYNNKAYTNCTRDGLQGIDDELWCATTANYDKDKKWGYCICGVCQCDSGYSGKSCATVTKILPRFLKEDFESSLSRNKWAWVGGGTIGTLCGTVVSGNAMVFNTGRSRLLETIDLDLTMGMTVRFSVRVGSSRIGCPRPSDNTENIFLQYSTNGGVMWTLMATIQYNESPSLKNYNLSFPSSSKMASTRIRWYQPISDSYLDVWAIDDVAIDSIASSLPCASSPCLNHATCTNEINGFYTCQCPLGFNGRNCQIPPQYCNSNPCANGGTCTDLLSAFYCSCLQGYTGKNCETDIDECSRNPCKNGATCVDLVNNYSCQCPSGMTGRQCQIDVNECSPSPCNNGGNCIDLIGGYRCQCPLGVTGRHCQININECQSRPCQHGGRCFDRSNGYYCDCRFTGYEGVYCETQTVVPTSTSNPCENTGAASSCRNGGSCIATGSTAFSCVCATGYTGKLCDALIITDPCRSVVCKNDGVCNAGRCECVSGYTGTYCTIDTSDRDPCDNVVCGENSECRIASSPSGYSCSCSAGFTGSPCRRIGTSTQNCDSRRNPCRNGAMCRVDTTGRYRCLCEEGYTGNTCATRQNTQGGNSDTVNGDNNSDGTPFWIYAVAGGGGLLTICSIIAAIFSCRRRQGHAALPDPKHAVTEVPNPVYHGSHGAPRHLAREHIPATMERLPAGPQIDNSKWHNHSVGYPNRMFLPDTLPRDRPPLFDTQ